MYNFRGNGGGKISTLSKHTTNCFLSQVTQGLEIQCHMCRLAKNQISLLYSLFHHMSPNIKYVLNIATLNDLTI